MYNTSVKFPYKKNNKKPLKPVHNSVADGLVDMLKASKFYNHELIKNNRKISVNNFLQREDANNYNEFSSQMQANTDNQEMARENRYYVYILNSLRFIEKLPTDDYLLVINYLFNDMLSKEELMEEADVATRQGLYRKVKRLIIRAHKQYFRDYLD